VAQPGGAPNQPPGPGNQPPPQGGALAMTNSNQNSGSPVSGQPKGTGQATAQKMGPV
jgi:hypothetical protein